MEAWWVKVQHTKSNSYYSDTTASLLGNVWFVLAKRPDVWVKLRQEVDALNGEQPTYEQIKNMKYLKYVLNESNVSQIHGIEVMIR